jgi:hypothetical protein
VGGLGRGDFVRLNKALLAARSIEEMVELVREAGDGLNAVNAATALHQLAKRSGKARRSVTREEVELLNKHVGRTLDDFKPQELANSLWAWATLGAHPGEELLRSVGRAVERKLGDFNVEAQMQVFQAHLLFSAMGPSSAQPQLGLSEGVLSELREVWKAEAKATRVSRLQRDVARVLEKELGVESAMEVTTEDELFSIDVVPRGTKVAVEVDGPSHFVRTLRVDDDDGDLIVAPKPNGATLARRKLLGARGWTVVSVPYFEWDACEGDAARQAQLLAQNPTLAALARRSQP